MKFEPIGTVHSPYKEKVEAPIQPKYSKEEGQIEIYPEFADGLKDLEGFSHIWVLFVFHKSDGYGLHVKPYLDEKARGVFACRAPRRPNPIGMSLMKLESINENILNVRGLDMLDGSPVLDIKPYVGDFDEFSDVKIGWLEDEIKKAPEKKGGAFTLLGDE